MLYLKWAIRSFPSVFMAVFGRIPCPILPFFVTKNGHLPNWLRWFDTPFDTADGDDGHQEKWPGTDWWSTYKRRVAWYWRNCCYGFDMEVLGIRVDPDKDEITVDGDPNIGDNTGISGVCNWNAYRNGEHIAFQWMYVKHYEIFGFKKCIRIGIGWKIWDNEKLREMPAQYWIYFNLFK